MITMKKAGVTNPFRAGYVSFSSNSSELGEYLKKVNLIKNLEAKEEKELAIKAKNGDLLAKRILVQSNLKLVLTIARKTIHVSKLPLVDLIQEGNLGLMIAVEKFNPELGYRFSTYATWWIKQAIVRAIANNAKTIRVPVYMSDKIRLLKKTIIELTFSTGKEPTDEELSAILNLPLKKIKSIKKAIIPTPLSLDIPIAEDLCLEDYISDDSYNAPEKVVEKECLYNDLMNALSFLNQKERHILQSRFGLNGEKVKTLEELGKIYGFSKERIRQLESNILQKIRASENIAHLKEYLN